MRDETTRCFIALDLSEEFKEKLEKVQNQLKEKHLFKGKFTEKENMHLTLKFLGELSAGQLEDVKKQLQQVEFTKSEARLEGLGVFSPKHIRIIWAHLVGAEKLQQLVDEALSDMFSKENRFQSHITIARAKKVPDRKALLEAIDEIKIPKTEGSIESFSLVISTLTPEGPVYEVIETYKAIE